MPERQRRGYPVAMLIGLNDKKTNIWRIYSEKAVLEKIILISRDKEKSLYDHYEEIVNFIRPIIKSGITSIILSSSSRSKNIEAFLNHIKKRHKWLLDGKNSITIGEVIGEADTPKSTFDLVKGNIFKNVLSEITAQDSEKLLPELEKCLEYNEILYTIDEIHKQLSKEEKPDIILLTDIFYETHKRNRRLQSFIQIAQNNLVKTRIINKDSKIGGRIQQFGGLVALLKVKRLN
jgi:stalled ribosome rescue protein Dom34